MMGNFLTTLGADPEEDRAMFTEQGLNIARQLDNGRNPRPDNRSGWLSGETPDVVGEHLGRRPGPPPAGDDPGVALHVRLWDPSAQLRFSAKRTPPPRPDGAPNTVPSPVAAGWGD